MAMMRNQKSGNNLENKKHSLRVLSNDSGRVADDLNREKKIPATTAEPFNHRTHADSELRTVEKSMSAESLQKRIDRIELSPADGLACEVVSSGFHSIDQMLPVGGVRRGSLVEWLATEDGCGASTLVFAVARCVTPQDGTILVIDRAFSFHPPAVLPWMSQRHMVIAHPSNTVDEAWSIDQSLQCSGVSVVVAWLGCIHPTAMRRWHLAARKSGVVGLFIRSAQVQSEPSWAEARILVQPLPCQSRFELSVLRRLQVTLLSGFGMNCPRRAEVVIELEHGLEYQTVEIAN